MAKYEEELKEFLAKAESDDSQAEQQAPVIPEIAKEPKKTKAAQKTKAAKKAADPEEETPNAAPSIDPVVGSGTKAQRPAKPDNDGKQYMPPPSDATAKGRFILPSGNMVINP